MTKTFKNVVFFSDDSILLNCPDIYKYLTQMS